MSLKIHVSFTILACTALGNIQEENHVENYSRKSEIRFLLNKQCAVFLVVQSYVAQVT